MAAAGVPDEQEQVLEANHRFYEALAGMNLDALTEIWLPEDWVRCVHPGWPQIEGWVAVRESFEQIFANTDSLRISISGASAHLEQDTAWVTCVEKISSSGGGRGSASFVQSTNLFVRREGRWRMVQHHASHLPVEVTPQEMEHVN